MKKLILLLTAMLFLFSCTVLNREIKVYKLSTVENQLKFVNEDNTPVANKTLNLIVRRGWTGTFELENGKEGTNEIRTDKYLTVVTDASGFVKLKTKANDFSDTIVENMKNKKVKRIEEIREIWVRNEEYNNSKIAPIGLAKKEIYTIILK